MSPRAPLHWSTLRKACASVGVLALAAVLLVVTQIPGADGAFIAKVANSTNNSATNPYFTCTAYASDNTGAVRATFDYPLGETLTTGTAANVSGSGTANNGTYSLSGVSSTANSTVCPRDKKGYVANFNGSSGYVTGPATAVAGPTTFSIEAWFKTSTSAGKIIGFGSSLTGSSSNNDRALYIGSDGYLYFGVYPNQVVTVTNRDSTLPGADATSVTDGQWHFAVATISSAGMALYLDGVLVATNSNTGSQSYSGYWRIGYDNTGNWTMSPTSYYFNGQLAWVAAWNSYALSATQVAQQYAAGR